MPTLADIVSKARKITGNVDDTAVGETNIPDDAIEIELKPTVQQLATAHGTSAALKEVIFTAVANTQDYALATYLGDDVFAVESVVRSGAYLTDRFYAGQVDPRTGLSGVQHSPIVPGYQGSTFDAILAQARARLEDHYSWEVVNGTTLRLMPVPTADEVVAVRYVATGADIEDLPENTETVLVYAAVVAILNGILNRRMADRATAQVTGPTADQRLRTLCQQRDYYQRLRDQAIKTLNG